MRTKQFRAVVVTGLAAALATTAFAHTRLEASSPSANAVVPAPKEIRLQFSEPLELPFSKVTVLDQEGTVIQNARAELDKTNDKGLVVPMPALKPGAYRVQWRTVTRDGHKVKGEYSFQVK